MILLDSDNCKAFITSSSREWIETNGIGGYASGSISGAGTRRYHGLLIAATRPPLGRVVMLSKFEESVTINGERFDLSCNQYPGAVYPEGYKYLTSFRLDPFPIWTYELNGVELERSVVMVSGENSTIVRWSVKKRQADTDLIELELKPLLAFRDHHHLRHVDPNFDGGYDSEDEVISIRPYAEMPTLYLAHNAAGVKAEGHWYRDLEYAIDRERGFDYHEDLFQPFSLTFGLNDDAVVIASTEKRVVGDAGVMGRSEFERRARIVAKAGADGPFETQLVLAADQFIVDRGKGKTVIAGYPWFSDWGRDTMIALKGLTLTTGRPEIAKSILTEFSRHISEGMLPNRFPDEGEVPEYNTVDATLWFFEAIRSYAEVTGDHAWVRDALYGHLVDIIDWHARGTRYGIHVDTDGMLYAGEPGVQLTWMDAKIGDWVVTPRTGKPVEIQALWYNALCIMVDFARLFGDEHGQKLYPTMAETARSSFNGQFWNSGEDCLYDVVNGSDKDGSVRPNQIFTVSLPYSMLSGEKARSVVDKVERELLTPFGLRSLSPADPNYTPVYIGSPLERDSAYHQGTVWGWLIGPFITAYRKVHSKDPKAEQYISGLLAGFERHLTEGTVGQVSEIFDGESPHLPRGAGAQAWSVAELLRVLKDPPK